MTIRVAELFAGVGGFRLALDGYSNPEHPELKADPAGDFETVWANQWEPDGRDSKQFAWRCYEHRFGEGTCVNEDINIVLDEYEAGKRDIPDFDMLVGGFPCQDYSVAKPLSRAGGIEGKKGVLWWDIYRMLHLKKPRYVLLENVDRLLKSPSKQRGRDFAIMLSCLNEEGYSVEWRVINAAEYGMPQKRRRVYIFGELDADKWDLEKRLLSDGIMARAFPILETHGETIGKNIGSDPYEVSQNFASDAPKVSVWQNAGVMQDGSALTCKVFPSFDGHAVTLGELRVSDSEVPEHFFIKLDDIPKWEAQRASKKIERTTKEGFTYLYSEGAMPWPDPLDKPARTILTGEGGAGASRMKHAIYAEDGRIRRLVPDELDMIQMFPKGWTADEGDGEPMSEGHRAFCMGNALVVGIPHRIGKEIAKEQ